MARLETLLRVILVVHFVLSAWALQAEFWLPHTYILAQIALWVLYLWGIIQKESSEAILLATIFTAITCVMDIVVIAVYFRWGQDNNSGDRRSEFLFAFAMSIVGIIFKVPYTLILYRLYRERGGQVPAGMPSFPGMPGNWGPQRSAYGDIDNQPSQVPPGDKPDVYQTPPPYQTA